MRFLALLLPFATLLLAQHFTIAGAANTRFVIKPLIAAFQKKHPGVQIDYTTASSGKLTAMILHGAPYEIFLSADMQHPQKLYQQNYTLTPPKIYAYGTLIIFSTQQKDFSNLKQLLLDTKQNSIALANPKTAPYGKAAMEVMQNWQISQQLQKRLIYGESIAQTLQFALRASEFAFLSKSVIYASNMHRFKENKHWVEIDPHLYTPIAQGAVLLKSAQDNKAAQSFFEFLSTQEAKKILQNNGYTLP